MAVSRLATLLAFSLALVYCSKVKLVDYGDPADKYQTNEELEGYLHAFAEECGHISKLLEFGRTALGTPLYALEISDNPGELEPEPYFRYIANMHGDEPTGRVHLVKLAEWLCDNYHGGDPRAARLVNNMHLVLIPTMNPDGFAAGKRSNSNRVDLNRNFPDRFKAESMEPTGMEEAETQAIMALAKDLPFVASANLHEGALVANYPWDATPNGKRRYSAAPDDAAFVYFAHLYADTHPSMHLPQEEFEDGITNGAAWYVVYGSMQDWTYVATKALPLTLELSVSKTPPADTLHALWADNKDALIDLALGMALGGIHGTCKGVPLDSVAAASTATHSSSAHLQLLRNSRVVEEQLPRGFGQQRWRQLNDAAAAPAPLACHVTLDAQEKATAASERFGDFHRVVEPGKHVLKVGMEGYQDVTIEVVVPADGSGVDVEIELKPLGYQDHGLPDTHAATSSQDPSNMSSYSSQASLYKISQSKAEHRQGDEQVYGQLQAGKTFDETQLRGKNEANGAGKVMVGSGEQRSKPLQDITRLDIDKMRQNLDAREQLIQLVVVAVGPIVFFGIFMLRRGLGGSARVGSRRARGTWD